MTTPIILDTDMDTDCDDAAAVGLLHALADLGEAEILAILVSSVFPGSVACVRAINRWYGRPDLPVGVVKGGAASIHRGSRYAREIAEEFGLVGCEADTPDAVDVCRRILADAADASVVFVTIGYQTNLSNLLRSGPDEHSDLPGRELVERKVRTYVCMGSVYPADHDPREWGNFKPDPAATCHVVAEWPTPITFTGGGPFARLLPTGRRLFTDVPAGSPVRWIYELFHRDGPTDHHSADQIAVMVAVRGPGPPWRAVTRGHNHIFENGTHEWRDEPDDPRQQYVAHLAEGVSPADVAAEIEELMVRPPARST